jgi:hypothetical protein
LIGKGSIGNVLVAPGELNKMFWSYSDNVINFVSVGGRFRAKTAYLQESYEISLGLWHINNMSAVIYPVPSLKAVINC